MIKASDFYHGCHCRGETECRCRLAAEIRGLGAMTTAFAKAMLDKLCDKAVQGFHGWDDDSPATTERLRLYLREQVEESDDDLDPIDIANFAAMIWNREQASDAPK